VVFFLVARSEHVDAFALVHEELKKQWTDQILPSAHVAT
jgi:hypothetical protein